MPSVIFSHQAPGLALKLKYPKKLDGTALCIGTIVPDLTSIIDFFFPFSLRGISHSLLGLLYYTVPLSLLLVLIFRQKIAPFLARIAKKEGKLSKSLNYLGMETWDNLKNKKYNRKSIIVAIYSVLIGGLIHILLDLPSHEYVELFFPFLIFKSPEILLFSLVQWPSYNLTLYELIWMIESLIGLIFAIYFLRYIKKKDLIKKWYREI